jgi:hypothetical protein
MNEYSFSSKIESHTLMYGPQAALYLHYATTSIMIFFSEQN